jgi:hypothetical protein
MAIEWNGCQSPLIRAGLIHVPSVISCISGNINRLLVQGLNHILIQWEIMRDIGRIEWLGIFGQNHIPIISGGGCNDARAVSPEIFLLDLCGTIRLFFIGALFDSQFRVRGGFLRGGKKCGRIKESAELVCTG